jgi:uncharacterized membrane protein YphA (DoxX/SURF4 family)
MTMVRRLARPLLALPFIQMGADQFRHPTPTVEAARPVLEPLVAKAAGATALPDNPELVVRAGGAVLAGSSVLFALGRAPRLSALLMTTSLVPTVYATGQFWKETDPVLRREKRGHVLATLGLVGGALLAAVDTEGRPGVAWRAEHASHSAKKSATRATKDTRRAVRRAKKDAVRTTAAAAADAKRAAKEAKRSTGRALHDVKAGIS